MCNGHGQPDGQADRLKDRQTEIPYRYRRATQLRSVSSGSLLSSIASANYGEYRAADSNGITSSFSSGTIFMSEM